MARVFCFWMLVNAFSAGVKVNKSAAVGFRIDTNAGEEIEPLVVRDVVDEDGVNSRALGICDFNLKAAVAFC